MLIDDKKATPGNALKYVYIHKKIKFLRDMGIEPTTSLFETKYIDHHTRYLKNNPHFLLPDLPLQYIKTLYKIKTSQTIHNC